MIGTVDDRNRALIDLEVRQTPNSPGISVTASIDAILDGHLVFPLSLIQELELESLVDTEANYSGNGAAAKMPMISKRTSSAAPVDCVVLSR